MSLWLKCLLVLVLVSFLANLSRGWPLKNGFSDTANDEAVDINTSNIPRGNSAISCRCKAGYHAVPGCKSQNNTHCLPCKEGTFSERTSERTLCHTCSLCKDSYFKVASCTRTYDTKCAPCHKASADQQNLNEYLVKCRMSSDDPMSWLSLFGIKAPKLDFKFDEDPNTQGEEGLILGGMMGDTYIQNSEYKTNATSTSSTTSILKGIPSANPMPLSTPRILTTEKMAKDTSSSTTEPHGEGFHSMPVNSGPVEPQNAQPAFVVQDTKAIVVPDPDKSNVGKKARDQAKPMKTADKRNDIQSDSVAIVANATQTDLADESLVLDGASDHQGNNTETHVGAINKAYEDERLVSYWVVIGATLVVAVVFFLLGFLASRRASKPKEDDKPALPPDPLLLQRRSSVEFRYRRRFSLDQPGAGASLLSHSDSFRGKPLMVDKSVQTTSSQDTSKSKKGIKFWRSSSSSAASSPTAKDDDDVFESGPKDKMKIVNEVESSIPLLSSTFSSNISPATPAAGTNACDDGSNHEMSNDQSVNINRELKPNNSFRTFKGGD